MFIYFRCYLFKLYLSFSCYGYKAQLDWFDSTGRKRKKKIISHHRQLLMLPDRYKQTVLMRFVESILTQN